MDSSQGPQGRPLHTRRPLNSPLNMGASFHTPRPPMEVYWPREHSRRKSGTPAKISVRKYGIRKAPGGDTCTALQVPSSSGVPPAGFLPRQQHPAPNGGLKTSSVQMYNPHCAKLRQGLLKPIQQDYPWGLLIKRQMTRSGPCSQRLSSPISYQDLARNLPSNTYHRHSSRRGRGTSTRCLGRWRSPHRT